MKKFDKNCLLCKYKYDSNACFDAVFKHGYNCPSLSNIFYGKIVKMTVIKQIYDFYEDIKDKYLEKKHDKEYISEYETTSMKFIWGLKSFDDLCNCEANLYTMNDLDLIYLKDEDKYILGVETIYVFTSDDGKYEYLQDLLYNFTRFMKENNYDTTHEFELYEDICITNHFDSIEEAYAAFKMYVNGFCSLRK
jgi:hypothetical protein